MDIVFSAAVIYLFLWMITRLVGPLTVGELSTFQLILFITMGAMVQQAVTQQDHSVTASILAISVFTVLTMGLSWANARWPGIRKITHGVPVVIVDNGTTDPQVSRREQMSVDDSKAAARQQGFESLTDIRLAVLEANGQISFFPVASGGPGTSGTGGTSGAQEKPAVG